MRTKFPAMPVLAFAVLVLLGVAAAQAQPQRWTVEERVKNLTEQLTLSADQVKNVEAILKKSEVERKKLFESAGDDREAMRESMRALRDKENTAIEALLTPEQKTKYAEIRKQGPPRGMGQRPPGR